MGFDHFTLEYERRLMERENLPVPVKEVISGYVDSLVLESLSERRRMNIMQRLRVVARMMPNQFLSPSRSDMVKIVSELDKKYAEWTKVTFLRILKKFYRSQLPKSKFDKLFDGIKIKQPKSKVQKSDLITENEYNLMLENCKHVRDKAIISTLYDSGCRVGELLTMKVSSVKMDDYGAILEVPWLTKTGFRQVRVIGNSVFWIKEWSKIHPKWNDLNSPLFCNIADSVRGRAMTYDDIRSALQKVLKRAGIERRIHPHLFRHSRASILASKPLAMSVFEDQMGWTPGTKMTATYVHLSGKQSDIAILKAQGIDVKENSAQDSRPVRCPRCNSLNPNNVKRCVNCWLPLDLEEAIREKERKQLAISAIRDSEFTQDIERDLLRDASPEFEDEWLLKKLEKLDREGKLTDLFNRIKTNRNTE
jgi:integrase/recombinase XerD